MLNEFCHKKHLHFKNVEIFFKLHFRKYLENIEINLHLDFATCSVRLTIPRTSSTSVAFIQSGF